MPYTLAHPIAVAPLRRPLARAGVTTASLVCGAMAPDAVYFVRLTPLPNDAHSLAGLFTHCLPQGLAMAAAWTFWLAPRLADWFRLPRPDAPAWRRWIGPASLGVLIGAATHLLWDATSHDDGWVVARVGWLREPLGSRAAYKWNQYASGTLGSIAVAVWAWRSMPPGLWRRVGWRRAAVMAAIWLACVGGLVTTANIVHHSNSPKSYLIRFSVGLLSGTATAAALVSLLASLSPHAVAKGATSSRR